MVSNNIFPGKKRSRKARFSDEEQNNKLGNTSAEFCFKRDVFYVLLDCVIGNMNWCFEAAKGLEETFGVVWKYMTLDKDLLREKASSICVKYSIDVSLDLIDELEHLKAIHASNLGIIQLLSFQLLNKLHELKLDFLFPNILVVLRTFCTLRVTVAQAERSFSTLARVKNVLQLKKIESQNDERNIENGTNNIKEKIAELEDRSRRNNLRFIGIRDKANETWEESEQKIKDFLNTKLNIQEKNLIDRAHRVGKENGKNSIYQ
nr:uncharacterized protein LOC124817677 [Hydra vulgaris]